MHIGTFTRTLEEFDQAVLIFLLGAFFGKKKKNKTKKKK